MFEDDERSSCNDYVIDILEFLKKTFKYCIMFCCVIFCIKLDNCLNDEDNDNSNSSSDNEVKIIDEENNEIVNYNSIKDNKRIRSSSNCSSSSKHPVKEAIINKIVNDINSSTK